MESKSKEGERIYSIRAKKDKDTNYLGKRTKLAIKLHALTHLRRLEKSKEENTYQEGERKRERRKELKERDPFAD